MWPYDDTSKKERFAIILYMVIFINGVVFLWSAQMANIDYYHFLLRNAAIPKDIMHRANIFKSLLDMTRSMFLHGGWWHFFGNMLYLFAFGRAVENRLGTRSFIGLYMIGGYVATMAHVLLFRDSTVPLVGASGAISAVLGAYLVFHHRESIRGIIWFSWFPYPIKIPAILLLGLWFLIQMKSGVASIVDGRTVGVAFMAHVGGFLFGFLYAGVYNAMIQNSSRKAVGKNKHNPVARVHDAALALGNAEMIVSSIKGGRSSRGRALPDAAHSEVSGDSHDDSAEPEPESEPE